MSSSKSRLQAPRAGHRQLGGDPLLGGRQQVGPVAALHPQVVAAEVEARRWRAAPRRARRRSRPTRARRTAGVVWIAVALLGAALQQRADRRVLGVGGEAQVGVVERPPGELGDPREPLHRARAGRGRRARRPCPRARRRSPRRGAAASSSSASTAAPSSAVARFASGIRTPASSRSISGSRSQVSVTASTAPKLTGRAFGPSPGSGYSPSSVVASSTPSSAASWTSLAGLLDLIGCVLGGVALGDVLGRVARGVAGVLGGLVGGLAGFLERRPRRRRRRIRPRRLRRSRSASPRRALPGVHSQLRSMSVGSHPVRSSSAAGPCIADPLASRPNPARATLKGNGTHRGEPEVTDEQDRNQVPSPPQRLPSNGNGTANGKTLSTYITERFDEFSRSQKDVARYIVDHLEEAAFQTAEELARRADTSSSTVVRFSQALGFEGYPELQQAAIEEYRAASPPAARPPAAARSSTSTTPSSSPRSPPTTPTSRARSAA